VRFIDTLDEACTNADDQIMLVRHRSGDRIMIEHGCLERTADFLSDQRRATDFVETAAGRTANNVQFAHSALGNEGGGGPTSLWGHSLLGVEVIFDRRRDRGVVCVFSILNAGRSVCGCTKSAYMYSYMCTKFTFICIC